MDADDYPTMREIGEFFRQRERDNRAATTEISEKGFNHLRALVGSVDATTAGVWRMNLLGRPLLFYHGSNRWQYRGKVTKGGVPKLVRWIEDMQNRDPA